MKSTRMEWAIAAALVTAACGDDKQQTAGGTTSQTSETTDTTGTTSGGSTGGPGGETAEPTTVTGTGGSSGGGSSGSFITPSDMAGGMKQCDQWVQDCPEGQKCMPYSGDGDNSWESLKCVPVKPNPGAVGDGCTTEGAVSGIDDCDKGLMCWNVDPMTGQGVCVAMCVGSPANPSCDAPMTTCLISNDGVLTLCLPICDPLVQDCPGTDVCIPNPQDTAAFLCVLDASGDEGQEFDPCQYINSCDKGFFCGQPTLGNECDPNSTGCCLPFCDLSGMPMCNGAGQECLPWYGMETPPPGFEDVGYCGIPQ